MTMAKREIPGGALLLRAASFFVTKKQEKTLSLVVGLFFPLPPALHVETKWPVDSLTFSSSWLIIDVE